MRWLRRILLALTLLIVVALISVWGLLRASLPPLDGERSAPGLQSQVTIERDATGIVTVRGASEEDAAFGLGFAHAQDRYFQMDLARRLGAGELAGLFGATALPLDRRVRPFRMRARIRQFLATLPPQESRWLTQYAAGVNEGLGSLESRPFEYWLLRSRPARWLPEDSLLVSASMAWQLQSGEIDAEKFWLALGAAIETPEGGDAAQARSVAIAHLLSPRPTEWDAPLTMVAADGGNSVEVEPELPTPEQWDLRSLRLPSTASSRAASRELAQSEHFVGSNGWGLGGARTANGAALVANDMHLGLGVPPVWYRAQLLVADRSPLNGVTLPGLPALVAGSNGDIAWGFTNSYGDWIDLRRVGCDIEKNEWQSRDGLQPFDVHRESLAVRGGVAEILVTRMAGNDVVIEIDTARGECTLASWTAIAPGAINLKIREFARATSVDEALALASSVAIPQQNLIVGDRQGRIAWALIGGTPHGPHPSIVDPADSAVWSANARPADGEAERAIGGDEWRWGAGYDLGARARQIRDGLRSLKTPAIPADMLRIQLDDRAEYLARWRGVLLGLLDDEAVRNKPARAELRMLVERWDGRAGVESVGYRLLRVFQRRLSAATWQMLLGSLNIDAADHRQPRRFDASVWRLVNEQPPHLLAADFSDWRAFMLAQVDASLANLADECPKLSQCRWGDVSRSGVRHPLSRFVPVLGQWLDMRDTALAGDADMPRVQGSGFGASERFAVSPGFEQEGYLQLPGGQSGHPLSTYFRSGYEDWVAGRPTPFLPGPPQHKLVFTPRKP